MRERCICSKCGQEHLKGDALPYNYSNGKKCPLCGKNITNMAKFCIVCTQKQGEEYHIRKKRNDSIIALWKTGKYTQRVIARKYGVTPALISYIVKKEEW